jgi:hypothetical protein
MSSVLTIPSLGQKPSDPKPLSLSQNPLPIDLGSKAGTLGPKVGDPAPLK